MHISVIGQGPDLVMLHGWSMHSGVWQTLAKALSTQYKVHLVDLPGHGHSQWQTGDFEWSVLLPALAEALPSQAIYVGWSLGGLISLAMAQRYPEQVSQLVLIAVNPCFTQRDDWPHAMDPAVFKNFSEQLEFDQAKTLQQFLLLQAQGSRTRKETVVTLAKEMAEVGPADHAALVAGLDLLVRSDMRGALADIDCPVSAILGERDTLVPSEVVEDLATINPKLKSTVIPGAGHAPFIAEPEVCQQAIIEFVEAV